MPRCLKSFIRIRITLFLLQVGEMLRSVKFYVLYFIVLTMSLALLCGSELYKELAKDTILDDTVSTYNFYYRILLYNFDSICFLTKKKVK